MVRWSMAGNRLRSTRRWICACRARDVRGTARPALTWPHTNRRCSITLIDARSDLAAITHLAGCPAGADWLPGHRCCLAWSISVRQLLGSGDWSAGPRVLTSDARCQDSLRLRRAKGLQSQSRQVIASLSGSTLSRTSFPVMRLRQPSRCWCRLATRRSSWNDQPAAA